MSKSVNTVREGIATVVDFFTPTESITNMLHCSVVDSVNEFDEIALIKYTYRSVKNKKGKSRQEKAGTIAFSRIANRPDIPCSLAFSVCNPTDKWDEKFGDALCRKRIPEWNDCTYAYVGRGGEKDIDDHDGVVFIPHHFARHLYEFIAKVRSLVGGGARFPKWVYHFLRIYGLEQEKNELRKEQLDLDRAKKKFMKKHGLTEEEMDETETSEG